MATYSFFAFNESNISVSGTRIVDGMTVPKTLDGLDQGDGSHLVGETITINSANLTEIVVDDSGTETNFADNESGQNLAADITIDGEDFTAGTRIEAEYQFEVEDADGNRYTVIAVNIVNGSPGFATIEALAFVDELPPQGVPLDVVGAAEGPGNSGASAIDEARIVPCISAGTLIATATGPKPIEQLTEGEKIQRADGTYVGLRRLFSVTLSADELSTAPHLMPVRIVAGALGRNLPSRDLLVSRQHRMLMSSKIAERMFSVRDVLIPAVKLTALPGIFTDPTVAPVTYYHLLFDQHEIIVAEGAPTESLFTGQEALKAVSPAARAEILALFPQIAEPGYEPVPARLIPSGRMQKQAVARHLKNKQPVLM